MKHRAALSVLAVSTLALAGCASAGESTDAKIQIVASTNVYGYIAQQVGGDSVTVTSIITSAAQDPHEYEPSSKDKLEVSKADLIVSNGAGYDAFMGGLITNKSTPVIEAVDSADDLPGTDDADDHDDHADDDDHADHADDADDQADDHDHADDHAGHGHVAGFNEHVWYDPSIMAGVAHEIAEELSELDPSNAAAFEERAKAFSAEVDTLSEKIDAVYTEFAHTNIIVTEPISLRLTDRMDMHNQTPAAFTEAVEEGQDVAPATLLETLKILKDDDVRVVVANTQTGGAETQRVIDEATAAGIPVIEFSEVMPQEMTYIEWMEANIQTLDDALRAGV